MHLLARAQALIEASGVVVPNYVLAYGNESETRARTALDDATFADAWERGLKLTTDEAVALAVTSI